MITSRKAWSVGTHDETLCPGVLNSERTTLKVLPFKKLYIASSAFVAAGWPNISAELDELVSLSRLLKVPVFLLEPARSNLRLTG